MKPELNFNSTMVRLKASTFNVDWMTGKFQFHYGTIKSITPSVHLPSCINFNSTMVRLKDLSAADIDMWYTNFNSTMVRLKVYASRVGKMELLNFNSTMVRLKGVATAESHCLNLFQFHYGTIKRSKFLVIFTSKNDISIPLWYD